MFFLKEISYNSRFIKPNTALFFKFLQDCYRVGVGEGGVVNDGQLFRHDGDLHVIHVDGAVDVNRVARRQRVVLQHAHHPVHTHLQPATQTLSQADSLLYFSE